MNQSRFQDLLSHYEDRGIASEFCQEMLGTLVDYDHFHNADLLHTLRTYFRCNGNAVEAAGRLFLHRNSLYYRLQRIETLLNVDLKDPQTRLALHFALEMAELLGEHPVSEESEL